MILIKPSFEITTPINGEEILKDIEKAARTCYKSEDKIGEYIKCPQCKNINNILDAGYQENNEVCGKPCWNTGDGTILGTLSHHDLVYKLIKRGHFAMLEFGGMITVKFICDRGVSHELVRHRLASFAQESTRFCNYGNNEHIQFIIPPWIKDVEKEICKDRGVAAWYNAMQRAENDYFYLVNNDEHFKWSPQEARSVLPNSLKTEINMSCNIREWREVFKQRTAEAAHPQMKELMRPLLDEFKKEIPIIFDDINY